ncbi:MAG: hypothetical protein C4312_05180, partial [Thermoflexus sp.]
MIRAGGLRPLSMRRAAGLALALAAAWGLGWAIAAGGPLLALGGLLGVALGALVLCSLDFAFLMGIGVIFLLPFATVPVHLGFVPTFLDLAVLGWLVSGLAWWAAGRPP